MLVWEVFKMGCADRRWTTSMNRHCNVRRVANRWMRHQTTSKMVWIEIVVNSNSLISKITGAFRPNKVASPALSRHPKTKISASALLPTLPKAKMVPKSRIRINVNGMGRLLRKMRSSPLRAIVSGRNAMSRNWRREKMSAAGLPSLHTAQTMTTRLAIHSIFLLFLLWKMRAQLMKQLQMLPIRRRSNEQYVVVLMSI